MIAIIARASVVDARAIQDGGAAATRDDVRSEERRRDS